MTDLPARLWVHPTDDAYFVAMPHETDGTEYVRADVARSDAQAAVALAVERAADEIKLRRHLLANVQNVVIPKSEELAIYDICEEAIRSLAPADGLAAVEALRKERDVWRKGSEAQAAGSAHIAAERAAALAEVQRLRAERDAALARVEKLLKALEKIHTYAPKHRGGELALAALDEDARHG